MRNLLLSIGMFSMLIGASGMAAANTGWSGVWVGWQCPTDGTPDITRCSNIVLELREQGGLICGSHIFATAGGKEMDEGYLPSVEGEVKGSVAEVVVTSGRAPVGVRVGMRLTKNGMEWLRLDDPNGDYLLPLKAQLTRSTSPTLLTPVYAQQLHSSCSSAFAAAGKGAPSTSVANNSSSAKGLPKPIRVGSTQTAP